MVAIIFFITLFITQILSAPLSYDQVIPLEASIYAPLNSKSEEVSTAYGYGSIGVSAQDVLIWIISTYQRSTETCSTKLRYSCKKLADAGFDLNKFHHLRDSCTKSRQICTNILSSKTHICNSFIHEITSAIAFHRKVRLRMDFATCKPLLQKCHFHQGFCGDQLTRLCAELSESCFRAREQDVSDVSLAYSLLLFPSKERCDDSVKQLCLLYANSTASLLRECFNPNATCEELPVSSDNPFTKVLLQVMKKSGIGDFFYITGLKYGIFPRGVFLLDQPDYPTAFVASMGQGSTVEQKCLNGFSQCNSFKYLDTYSHVCSTTKLQQDECKDLESKLKRGIGDSLYKMLKARGFSDQITPYAYARAIRSNHCHNLLERCAFLGFLNYSSIDTRCKNLLLACSKMSGLVSALLSLESVLLPYIKEDTANSDCNALLPEACYQTSGTQPEVVELCLRTSQACKMLDDLMKRRCKELSLLVRGYESKQMCRKVRDLYEGLQYNCKSVDKLELDMFLKTCKSKHN